MSWQVFDTIYIIRIGVSLISINGITFMRIIVNIMPLVFLSTNVVMGIIQSSPLTFASGSISVSVGCCGASHR